jgi:hypothetical protein
MTSVALAAAALLATAPAPTLHSGERQWFAPGRLPVGARVVCKAGGQAISLTVPAATSAQDAGSGSFTGGGIGASIATRRNGAVEVDCNTTTATSRRLDLPFVASKNGLGLIRGANTIGRLRRLYGPGDAKPVAGCRVAWPALGLVATFTSCTGTGALVRATITGQRWSSLNGVQIGDSIGRMLWQDQGARRIGAGTWALGGRGVKRPPRLLAYVSRLGVVTSFVVSER